MVEKEEKSCQMVYKKQTRFGLVGRNSCPGAKGWNPRNKKFRMAILVAADWVLSMQTMTWLTSRTSSAYSNKATKASFDPLSVIWAESTKTYNLPFHKTASQPALLSSALALATCVSEITRGRPLQFLTRKRSLKEDLVLGSNAWLAGSEGFLLSPTPVPCKWIMKFRLLWQITKLFGNHYLWEVPTGVGYIRSAVWARCPA